MSAPINPQWPPCPNCGEDLRDADLELGHGVTAAGDPEGKARLELVVSCWHCESVFWALVPVCELQEVE